MQAIWLADRIGFRYSPVGNNFAFSRSLPFTGNSKNVRYQLYGNPRYWNGRAGRLVSSGFPT